MMVALPVVADLTALPAEIRDSRIMALCDTAMARLYEARDVEDVIGLRNAAEAFAVYTRKMKAAVEAQNQCQLVVLLAEARIGAELKAAQERGEVARHGGERTKVRDADLAPATLAELGLPKQRAAEMKNLAAAGEGRIRDEVAAATREGRKPSKRNILNAIPKIAERPPECTQFVLWLRTGAALIPQLGTPESLIRRMQEHGMPVQASHVAAIAPFLSLLEERL